MDSWWPERAFVLTEVACTDARFADFAPYVPAIDDAGRVGFQAALRAGGSGVFVAAEGRIEQLAAAPQADLAAFISHPDFNSAGEGCVYAQRRDGRTALCRLRAGQAEGVAEGSDGPLRGVGPLGPTIDEDGVVGFRATTTAGSAVGKCEGGQVQVVAEAGGRFVDFRGLPIATRRGLVFLADLVGGGQELCRHTRAAGLTVLADTRGEFAEFGNFPAANEAGVVVCAARRKQRGEGIFVLGEPDGPREVVGGPAFASYRGALISESGRVVFFATPVGGALGIYRGPDSREHRVLGIGDAWAGSTVVEFALNPVSSNARGQLAIRVRLADGRGLLLRADPA
jgi:hypothetical protein